MPKTDRRVFRERRKLFSGVYQDVNSRHNIQKVRELAVSFQKRKLSLNNENEIDIAFRINPILSKAAEQVSCFYPSAQSCLKSLDQFVPSVAEKRIAMGIY